MYNYSIIIPHKNIPELLERCLASIPQRDDTEIIVIDDNSDPGKIDFANFPGKNRPDVKTVLSKNEDGRWGAGVSRNRALDMATGRWIIFVDSDDFLLPVASEVLDKYKDSDADIVFLGNTFVDCDTLVPITHIKIPQPGYIRKYLTTGDESGLRYKMNAPWGKLVKRSLIEEHGIRFSEVRCAEDMIFAVRIGHAAKTIVCDPTPFYCYVWREGALSSGSNWNFETLGVTLGEYIKVYSFLKSVGRPEIRRWGALRVWKHMMRIDRERAKPLLAELREIYPAKDVLNMVWKMRLDILVAPFRKLFKKKK